MSWLGDILSPAALVTASYEWDFSVVLDSMPLLLDGLVMTIKLAVVTMAISLVFGFLVALMRLSRYRALRVPAYIYTELFRTTPLLIQIIWFFFVMPETFGINLDIFLIGILALSLNVSAFLAEIYRAGIVSIDRGQREAALSTGMTEWVTMRRIILPQALRRVTPLIATIWISLFKDTSLVAIIGIHELMFEGRTVALATYRPVETFTVLAVMYFILAYPQSLVVNWLYERYRVVD